MVFSCLQEFTHSIVLLRRQTGRERESVLPSEREKINDTPNN